MIYEKNNDFYLQKIYIKNVEGDRFQFFENLCKNKKVLHIGCADAMSYGPGHNLHLKLKAVTSDLHGIDIDEKTLNQLEAACPGIYYSSYEDCKEKYDIVIAPEVLEHTLNAEEFFQQLISINSNSYFITVPNILHYQKEMIQTDEYSLEIVHPDHKYWFSPYTLYNICKQFIKDDTKYSMFYLDGKSMVAIKIDLYK